LSSTEERTRRDLKELEEQLTGGFASANLKKGLVRGYGVYTTNMRIIGVKTRSGLLAGAVVGGLVGRKITRDAMKSESTKELQEIEKKKDFEIEKDQISKIFVKKPGHLTGGHILITPKSGEEIKIAMYGKKEFETVKGLLKTFLPGALRIEE
jgi:hypothetical protein